VRRDDLDLRPPPTSARGNRHRSAEREVLLSHYQRAQAPERGRRLVGRGNDRHVCPARNSTRRKKRPATLDVSVRWRAGSGESGTIRRKTLSRPVASVQGELSYNQPKAPAPSLKREVMMSARCTSCIMLLVRRTSVLRIGARLFTWKE